MGLLQDWWDSCNFKLLAIASAVLVVLGLFILLFVSAALSFNKHIGQNEYGVWINYYNGDISSVHDQGAPTIPLGSKMYLFERVLQDSGITTISCLTGDGVIAELEVTVQYQYSRDEIIDVILLQFGSDGNFKGMLRTLLTSAVQDACGQFTAIQYQTERSTVDQAMQNSCQWKLGNASLLSQVLVQLKNIDLPLAYTTLVASKQSTDQQQVTALNSRAVALTQANTTLLNANLTAQIYLIDAKQTASINLLNAQAQSAFTYQQWVQRATGLLSVKVNNKFNNSQLLAYMKSQVVSASKNALLNL